MQTCEQFPLLIKHKLSVQFFPLLVGDIYPGRHVHVVLVMVEDRIPVHIVLFPHVFMQELIEHLSWQQDDPQNLRRIKYIILYQTFTNVIFDAERPKALYA